MALDTMTHPTGTSATKKVLPESEASNAVTFIRKVLRRAKVNFSSLIVALMYAERIGGRSALLAADPAGTFLALLLVADKFMFDATYTNGDWAEFSDHRYDLEELNRLEREVLSLLDYRLGVSIEDYDNFLAQLDALLCLQSLSWTSLSYRDLATLVQFPGLLGRSAMKTPANFHLPTMDAVFLLLRTVGVVTSTYLSAVLVTAVVLNAVAASSTLVPSPPGTSTTLQPKEVPFSELSFRLYDPFFVSFPRVGYEGHMAGRVSRQAEWQTSPAAFATPSWPSRFWENTARRNCRERTDFGNCSIPAAVF